jgi:hypothetical protein
MSHRKKTSRPDLSSRQAGQCVLAQGGDYIRTSFLSIQNLGPGNLKSPPAEPRALVRHEVRLHSPTSGIATLCSP